jgi:hypothetical protein
MLTARMLRPLAASGYVVEVGPYLWKGNDVTKALTIVGIAAGHKSM